MLKLRPGNVVVPDLYRFVVPEDGVLKTANTKEGWFEIVERHYRDNGYPKPENLREIMEDQVCRTLSGEWCEGGSEYTFVNTTRFTINDFIRGTKVLASFLLDGAQVVSQEEATERALICSRCPFNVSVPGCSACVALANTVMEAKGNRSTPHDHLLKSCAICHCSGEAQIWIGGEHLKKGVTPEMAEQFKAIDWCWKGKLLD